MPLCSSQIPPFLYHFVFLRISYVRGREVALECRQATILDHRFEFCMFFSSLLYAPFLSAGRLILLHIYP
jgi:hypothetical protein